MTPRSMRRPTVVAATAVAAAVAAGFAASALVDRGPAIPLRTSQARAMLPDINAYLNSRRFQDSPDSGAQPADGYLASTYPTLRSRWVCDAAILEIRPGRNGWHAGTDVACVEYARRGSTLLEGAGGDNGYYIISLSASGGQYQVHSATGGQLVPEPAWVRRHFSPGIAAELNNNDVPYAPWPAPLARRVFGLPREAPVVPG